MTRTLVVFFFLSAFSADLNAQLTLKITNIEGIEGDVHIGIYNDPDVFLSLTEQYIFILKKVDSIDMLIMIDTIPKGNYAISIMHDRNSNGVMDKNLIGIPKEPYGFSNNLDPLFRAPRFEEAQFYYDGEKLEIEIVLLD